MRHHIKKTIHITFGSVAFILGLIVISGVIRFLLIKGSTITPGSDAPDPYNMSYTLGGDVFNLIDGVAEKEYLPGSVVKNKLALYGDPVYGDLDQDRDTDAAAILVNDAGGSGSFYYGVLLINDGSSFKSTNLMYLGDRLEDISTKITEGHAVYGYNSVPPSDNMSSIPSVKRIVWTHYDKSKNQIGEWVKGFEGESR